VPEVVLRAAGSEIEFLAPAGRDDRERAWAQRIEALFGSATEAVRVTAACEETRPVEVWENLSGVAGRMHQRLEEERDRGQVPEDGALPFVRRFVTAAGGAGETPAGRAFFNGPTKVPNAVGGVCRSGGEGRVTDRRPSPNRPHDSGTAPGSLTTRSCRGSRC
jgi:hypothetical protein